jgi:hypothetical protein
VVPPNFPKTIAAAAPDDVWILSENGLYRGNGQAAGPWVAVTGGPANPYDLWAAGPNEVWALGQIRDANATPAAWHWNGQTWSSTPFPSTSGEHLGGTGPSDVWVLTMLDALHWDGQALSPSVLGAGFTGTVVAGSGPGDVWIGGAAGMVLHRGAR